MPQTLPTTVLLVAFAAHAILFWDAPRQWLRARREATVTESRGYRLANATIVGLLTVALAMELVWNPSPGFRPVGRAWGVSEWVADVIGVAGLGLAAWAKLTLGPWFTPTAATFPGQPLLQSGPYQWLHHPMYLGWWLFLVSLAWAVNSLVLLIVAVFVAPLLVALGRHERRLLEESAQGHRPSNARLNN